MRAVFNLDTVTIALLAGVLIPILTALVTKSHASSLLKSVVTLLLSSIAGWLAVAQSGVDYEWKAVLLGIALTWGQAIVSYYGLTTRVIAPQVANATPRFGIGKRAA